MRTGGFGLSQQFGFSAPSLPSDYDPDALALFARMTTQPSDARKALINTTIIAFKSSGLWADHECIWFPAAHTAQAAQLNWKGPSFTLLPVLSPTFTTDRGYAGNGATSYLNTQWIAANSSIFLQDSSALAIYLNAGTDIGLDTRVAAGNGSTLIAPRGTSGNIRGRINQLSSSEGSATATVLGMTTLSRTSSSLVSAYKNGAAAGTWTTASAGRDTYSLYLGGRNIADVAQSLVDNRIAFAAVSSGLTSGEVAARDAAVATYLTALGAA